LKIKKIFIRKIECVLKYVLSEKRLIKSIRNKFNIDLNYSENNSIIYKVADTKDEVVQALELLQEVYTEIDVVDKTRQTMRLNKYNVLPTSTIFVAIKGGEVIGTVTQILDTVIGLPIDGHSDISHLRETGEKICEISGLVVKKKWRNSNVFIPLAAYVKNYIRFTVGAKFTVIVINRNASLFYKAIFLFDDLEGRGKKYKGLNDYSAISFYVNNDEVYDKYESVYNSLPDNQNLYRMIINPLWDKQILRKNLLQLSCMEPIYSFDIMNIIKNHLEKTSLYEDLIIKSMFISNVGVSDSRIHFSRDRSSPRVNVNMQLRTNNLAYNIFDISLHGLSFLSNMNCKIGDKLEFSVDIGSDNTINLSGHVIWSVTKRLGLSINGGELKRWESFVLSLYSTLNFHY
jgi:hypothetical protein